jgi:hypothetical protein
MHRRRAMLRAGSLVALVAIASALFAACGDDSAEASLCTSLDDFQSAVGDLRDLNADSSREDFEAARDEVLDAWDSVVEDAGDVAGIRVDALQSAVGDLRSSFDDLPEDSTIREKIDELEPELDAIGTAFAALFSGLDCDS